MIFRFAEPLWLLLLLLVVPQAWAGLRWFNAMSAARRWSAVGLRAVLIALIAAMLAGASTVRTTDRLAVVAVIDVSGSVRRFADAGTDGAGRRLDPVQAAQAYFAAAVGAGSGGAGGRGPDDLFGAVVFDGRSLAIATPSRADAADRSFDLEMAEGTDIAGAIRYAAALIPPDAAGRLVLMSDGNQTAGDALAAARELAGRGSGRERSSPIDVIPLAYNVRREVIVEAVDAPPRAASESTVTVRVVLFSTDAAAGTLRLVREGEALDINGGEPGTGRRVELVPGRQVELVTVELEPTKIHRFEAVFEPDVAPGPGGEPVLVGDTYVQNNRGEAFTITPGKGAVLLLDGVSAGAPGGAGATLARALEESGIAVTTIAPEALPDDLLSLQAYDLVILENVPVEAISERGQEQLVAFVRDLGGGLVMVGGPDSFGAGGWKGSPVEAILPVKLDLPEQLVVPEAAIVLVLDNSGSMSHTVMGSTRTQQEIANEAAALAVRSLDAKDLVGVVTFNSTASVVVPLGPNRDAKATAARIASIGSGGGTNLGPGLEAAHEQLLRAESKLKHVVVLSDGRSLNAEMLPDYAAKMKRDGIHVSAIAVGDGADLQTMDWIARQGGGTYYNVSNPSVLPKIFLKAVRIVRSPLVREQPFDPVILPTASPLVAGLANPPPLGGLVLTQARDEPTITYAMAAPSGEPVLAHWSVELGQVGAFTSDAHDWAEGWLDWPGYRQMWTQIVRVLARADTDRGSELTTELVGDMLLIRLDAAGPDGRPTDLLTVPATVYGPGGEPVELRLAQTGPGVYEGRVPARESGNYIAVLKPQLGAQRLSPVIGGASVASGVEFRRLQSNVDLLRQIAETTGGRVLDLRDPASADLFDRARVRPSEASTPIWRTLLAWALVVLLLDVGTRRIAWDRFVSKEFGAEVRKAAADAVRDRSRGAARTLSTLRGRAAAGSVERAVSPAALGEEDARRVAMAETERRVAARLAAVEARRSGRKAPMMPVNDAPPIAAPGDVRDAPVEPPEPEPGSVGLLAAKQRARERFGGEGEP